MLLLFTATYNDVLQAPLNKIRLYKEAKPTIFPWTKESENEPCQKSKSDTSDNSDCPSLQEFPGFPEFSSNQSSQSSGCNDHDTLGGKNDVWSESLDENRAVAITTVSN